MNRTVGRPRRALATLAFVAALAAAAAGCGSTYVPRAWSGRVSMVITGSGSLALAREGRVYPMGAFGAGLLEAVRGDVEAERHARAYQQGTAMGFGLTLAGGGAAILGAAILPLTVFASGPGASPVGLGLSAVLVGSGLVTNLVGLFVTLAAAPRLYDAINVFNDRVESRAESERPRLPWMMIGTPRVLTLPPPPPPPPAVPPGPR